MEKLLCKMDGQHEAGLAVENLLIGNPTDRKTRISVRKKRFCWKQCKNL